MGVVLIGKSDSGPFFISGLKPGEFGCRAFNSYLVPRQRVFETARKTRANRIKFIIWANFKLGLDLRGKPSLAQSLKCIFAIAMIGFNTLPVPGSCLILEVILHRVCRRYATRRCS